MEDTTVTHEVNPSVWRRGQKWSYKDKDYIIRRTGAGNYMAFGIVEEAFQTGFTMFSRAVDTAIDEPTDEASIDIDENVDDTSMNQSMNIDEETEKPSIQKDDVKHDRNNEIIQSDNYKDHIYGMVQAIGHSRTHQWSAAMHLKTEDDVSVIVWGDKSNTKLFFEDDGVTENKVVFTPVKTLATTETAAKTINFVFSDTLESTEDQKIIPLAEVRIIRARSMQWGQGQAAIDPYLDALFALATLFEMVGIWSIRSVGVPMFGADESLWDAEQGTLKTDMLDSLRNWGINTKMLYPLTIRGSPTKIELYTPGDNPNFDVALKTILAEISIGTGIPGEKLVGNPVGLRSTEENQRNFFRAIGKIVSNHIQDFEWMYRRVWDIEDQDDFYLVVDPYEEMDELKQLEVKAKQMEVLSKMAVFAEKFGISPKVSLEYLGIDIEIDENLIAEFQKRRDELINNTSEVTSNATGKPGSSSTEDRSKDPPSS